LPQITDASQSVYCAVKDTAESRCLPSATCEKRRNLDRKGDFCRRKLWRCLAHASVGTATERW